MNIVPPWANDFMKEKGVMTKDSKIPCNTTEQMGNFTYVIDGIDYNLSGSDWVE